MIRLENLTKIYSLDGRNKTVADRINATFPTGVSVGLLGRNGAGKSSLLRMISGASDPTEGHIETTGLVSWPVGFAGSFHPDLTGQQNCRFIARIYGVDTDGLLAFVEDFAELGRSFHMPVRSYSSGMRSRLGFGASMGIRFDTYLVDETTAVGDAAFRRKSRAVFADRMRHSDAIMVNHSMNQVREFCNAGIVLENGQMQYFEDLEEAIAQHQALMA